MEIEGKEIAAAASLVVRPAAAADLAQLGVLAGALVRMHHDTDPERFLQVENVEEGYARFLGRELRRPKEAVVLVVESSAAPGELLGYAYATLEGRDWNMLLDTHGAIHDVFIAPPARRRGVGEELVRGAVAALEKLGAKRIVLHTMVSNAPAQRLFARCGFRATMLEMSR